MAESLQVGTTYRQVLKIALPISLAILVPQLNFIINNIFLGHFSAEALATASITGVYYLIFAAIGFGLNNGLQALISRRAGENDQKAIGLLFNQGILIALLISAFGILLTYTVMPLIFQYSIHSPEIRNKAITFLNIRILGLPFLYVYQMRNALLVGINRSKLLVIGTLAEALANIFFDYTLIFGKVGFPALGFNGAAIASVIAEFTGMITIFFVLIRMGISRQYTLFQNFRSDKVVAKKILVLSGPLIFQHAISIVSWFFFYLLVEHHGAVSLAVSNTMRNLFGFFGVSIWAFASTTSSMVSNLIGQGKKELVIPTINKIIRISLSITIASWIFLNLFPRLLLSVYGQGEEFMDLGIPVLRIVALAMLLMSFSIIWLHAVTGTGNSRMTFLIELITLVFYCIYVYLVLEVFQLSIIWGWMSELMYWTLIFSLSYWYMKTGRWKEKVI